ncbi:MAG: basic amino acid ABC transporter substrate-binding protein [Clostridia bacterium]|nr:basic amino acid ABC transporter substrate-binding protein [Clostridia bacterium]
MKVLRSKSVLLGLAVMLLVAFSLSACSGSKGGDVFRVGVDDVYPPMEFKDDKGATVGFDVDLANEIGKKLGKKVEFQSTQWDGIFTALKAEKFDCIISSVSVNEERLKEFEFTKPYIANAQVIIVGAKNTDIKSEKDLKDKKVGVQVGTTADESAEKFLKETKFDLKKYEQIIQPFSDMKVGRLDAIIVDEVVARYYAKTDNASFKVTGGRLTNEPIGICFKKGNTELRDKVQKAVDDLKADGTMKKLSEKWFGEDLVSNVQ